jgi:hypothetical protein
MSSHEQPILKKMLDRLFAAMMNGPNLNCRPHSSRQRIDLVQLSKLQSTGPEQILHELLGANRSCKVSALAKPPKQNADPEEKPEDDTEESEERKAERKMRQEFAEQTSVLNKLRIIVEDARTYENDTGVHVLQLGFPLLNLPPGKSGMPGMTRRIFAPLAFISLSISVKTGARPAVEFEPRSKGAGVVVPNIALLAWLERQTGHAPKEIFADEDGAKPWHEIVSIVKAVCTQLAIDVPTMFRSADAIPESLAMLASPKADQDGDQTGILPAAVIGLFPMSNQGLLRDTQAMIDNGELAGPLKKFLDLDPALEARLDPRPDQAIEKETRQVAQDRLITYADPCQSRAVKISRKCKCLVIHGPPGTGKSQTITNIIGDHLARGERVLFVCDKRTALNVVQSRLESLGLGSFSAIVHDPQRDQRDLYKAIREQLDNLTELRTDPAAEGQLQRIDAELQRVHTELTEFHGSLMLRPDKDSLSFHELVGQWLAIPSYKVEFDGVLIQGISVTEIENASEAIRDILDRAAKVKFSANPWSTTVGITLESFLATPVQQHRSAFQAIIEAVNAIAHVSRGTVPAFPNDKNLTLVGDARAALAVRLTKVMSTIGTSVRARWASADAKKLDQSRRATTESQSLFATIEGVPLDTQLAALIRSEIPTLPVVAQQIAAVRSYLETVSNWYGFFLYGKKKAAGQVLGIYGLAVSAENARRLLDFLNGVKARLMGKALVESLGHIFPAPFADDDDLVSAYREHTQLFKFLADLRAHPALADVAAVVCDALKVKEQPNKLLVGLNESAAHAGKLARCEQALPRSLIAKERQDAMIIKLRADKPPLKELQSLADCFSSIENVLRVKHGLRARLPRGYARA